MKTKLSWLLATIGSLWLLFGAFTQTSVTVAIIRKHAGDLPSKTSFSREEVVHALSELGRDSLDHNPWILMPTILIMAGFLLGQNKNKIPNNASERTS